MSKQSVEAGRKPKTSQGISREKSGADSPANPLPDEQEIAELAYQRWLERGCPQQSADEDWFEAERELRLGKLNSQ